MKFYLTFTKALICLYLCYCPAVFAELENLHIDFTGDNIVADGEDVIDDDYPMVTKVPRGFVGVGSQIGEGEWGREIDISEVQGITHDDDFYYITNQWEIYKVAKSNPQKVVAKKHLMKIQRFLKDGFYRHFGGITLGGDFIYVATTGRAHMLTTKKANPIIVVFDKNLNFIKFGRLPIDRQAGAAWTAINPVNGHLYSSYEQVVYEYTVDFENGEELKNVGSYKLQYRYADLSRDEWNDAVAQGGCFSNDGLLYYVLDLKHAMNSDATGIHAFVLHDSEGDEISFYGANNKGQIKPFISVKYRGYMDDDRFWEMEDVSFGKDSLSEYIDFLQLRNGKNDDARVERFRLIYDLKKALDYMTEKIF